MTFLFHCVVINHLSLLVYHSLSSFINSQRIIISSSAFLYFIFTQHLFIRINLIPQLTKLRKSPQWLVLDISYSLSLIERLVYLKIVRNHYLIWSDFGLSWSELTVSGIIILMILLLESRVSICFLSCTYSKAIHSILSSCIKGLLLPLYLINRRGMSGSIRGFNLNVIFMHVLMMTLKCMMLVRMIVLS